jgi:hypothetical protein
MSTTAPPRSRHAPAPSPARARPYSAGASSATVGQLSQRIREWGKINGGGVNNIGTIRAIESTEQNVAGRPIKYRITDDKGKVYTLSARAAPLRLQPERPRAAGHHARGPHAQRQLPGPLRRQPAPSSRAAASATASACASTAQRAGPTRGSRTERCSQPLLPPARPCSASSESRYSGLGGTALLRCSHSSPTRTDP